MGIKKIISISGKGGLFKIVGQTKNGFVVESLADAKRLPVDSSQRVSMLEDISIYTYEGDVPLADVLKKIREKHGDTLPVKPKDTSESLQKFFREVLPEYDEEQVYNSDIKKIVVWYDILKDIIDLPDEEDEGADEKDFKKEKETRPDAGKAAGKVKQNKPEPPKRKVTTQQRKSG